MVAGSPNSPEGRVFVATVTDVKPLVLVAMNVYGIFFFNSVQIKKKSAHKFLEVVICAKKKNVLI